MTTLTDFLLARIAEDEAVLKAASPGLDFNWGDYGISPELLADAEFFNRFADRPRVLAECEAKRRIVERYLDVKAYVDARNYDDEYAAELSGLETAVEFLATAYADHSDYRSEWGE